MSKRVGFPQIIALLLAAGCFWISTHAQNYTSKDPPPFDQVDSNRDGQVTPDEAAAAGLDVDWSLADKAAKGGIDRAEYETGVAEGSVKRRDNGTSATPPAVQGQ